jgi:hypothetical protein
MSVEHASANKQESEEEPPPRGGPTSHILPGASVQLRQVESDRHFDFMPVATSIMNSIHPSIWSSW